MASHSQKHKHKRTKAHRDDRRFRELYRYFQPANPAALLYSQHGSPSEGNPAEDASLALDTAPSIPSGPTSPNTTLTSFAQLVALRLNAQRAIISVLDRETEYYLAEATRTLNIRNVNQNGLGEDALWIGHGNDSRLGPKLNQITVALPASTKDQYQFHIVDDLSADESYKNLPFVAGPPHFRFYAGTPLTTENKINIGALFILDIEPRSGLTVIEKDTLGTVAALVIDFLSVSRQASEGRRATRLSRGLSCFVEGSSSFVDGLNPEHRDFSAVRSSTSPTGRSRESRASHSSNVDAHPSQSPGRLQNGEAGTSASSEERAETGTSSDFTAPLPDWLIAGTKYDPGQEIQSNHWAFRRAANLIRESLELTGDSGVIFLGSSNALLDVEHGRLDDLDDKKTPAPVLAVSTTDEPFAPEPGSTAVCAAASFDRRFLQQILRRYPKGNLWSFHRDRSLFVSSDDDEKVHPNSPVTVVKTPEVAHSSGKKWRATEAAQFAKLFPNASQVLFVPLWSAASSQWYAGCFCWNSKETQVFSPSIELASIMGFSYSIMAECSRVGSVIADRQKGDFIGSISHELRSPLHGILAAAEFMDVTQLNEFQKSLLETINACGLTLLDTMNQVLDFSKIVSLEKSWRQIKRSRDYRREQKGADTTKGVDSMVTLLDSYSCEDIAILAEEVVEGVCLGHSYGRSTPSAVPLRLNGNFVSTLAQEEKGIPRHDVEITVDIEEGNWVYKTQPGALRRIIMNILGNAMKYTERGRVSLRLESIQAHDQQTTGEAGNELVLLTVADTGKGISEDFLRARLYTPFAQEDTLAVGTGLGLSIVRSIVKSLGGHIGIRSQPGEGTTVKVSLPLARPSPNDVSSTSLRSYQQPSSQEVQILRECYSERTVAIVGFDPSSVNDGFLESSRVLARYVTGWFGLKLESWPPKNSVDILLAHDNRLTEEVTAQSFTRPSALIVFCSTSIDHESSRRAWSTVATSIDFLHRPCGPYKTARTILRCLNQLSGPANPAHPPLVDRARLATIHPNGQLPLEKRWDLPQERILFRQRHNSEPCTAEVLLSESAPIPDGSFSVDVGDEGGVGRRSASAIPVISEPESKAAPIQPSPEDHKIESITSLLNVLVVDDNQINLRLLLTYLSRRNVGALESAENGKMAVEAVERRQAGYDIIFMDISMPVMNGFEATRAIRALENERDNKNPATIIALTGLSSARDETEAISSGVDLFLTKPVSLKEVSRLLDEWEVRQRRNS